MKPPPFEYYRATTLEEAIALLSQYGPDAKVLAGGAMARLVSLETDQIRALCPLLAEAAQHIGHPPIRHQGTVCGSLAHADPAAELPVLALALDAELVATGPNGTRMNAANDFFVTLLTTNL